MSTAVCILYMLAVFKWIKNIHCPPFYTSGLSHLSNVKSKAEKIKFWWNVVCDAFDMLTRFSRKNKLSNYFCQQTFCWLSWQVNIFIRWSKMIVLFFPPFNRNVKRHTSVSGAIYMSVRCREITRLALGGDILDVIDEPRIVLDVLSMGAQNQLIKFCLLSAK